MVVKFRQPAYYRFYPFIRPEKLAQGWHRDLIVSAINDEGVTCYTGSCSEVYLEKALATVRPESRHPVAQELGETSLAFPVHATLTESDVEDTCRAVEKVMGCATQVSGKF